MSSSSSSSLWLILSNRMNEWTWQTVVKCLCQQQQPKQRIVRMMTKKKINLPGRMQNILGEKLGVLCVDNGQSIQNTKAVWGGWTNLCVHHIAITSHHILFLHKFYFFFCSSFFFLLYCSNNNNNIALKNSGKKFFVWIERERERISIFFSSHSLVL